MSGGMAGAGGAADTNAGGANAGGAGAEARILRVRQVLTMMEQTLECPICLEIMKEPVSTKCDHQFCCFCIQELLEKNKGPALCPLCKSTVTRRSLRASPMFKQIVAGVQRTMQAFQQDTGRQFTAAPGPPEVSACGSSQPGPNGRPRGSKLPCLPDAPHADNTSGAVRSRQKRQRVQTNYFELDVDSSSDGCMEDLSQSPLFLESPAERGGDATRAGERRQGEPSSAPPPPVAGAERSSPASAPSCRRDVVISVAAAAAEEEAAAGEAEDAPPPAKKRKHRAIRKVKEWLQKIDVSGRAESASAANAGKDGDDGGCGGDGAGDGDRDGGGDGAADMVSSDSELTTVLEACSAEASPVAVPLPELAPPAPPPVTNLGDRLFGKRYSRQRKQPPQERAWVRARERRRRRGSSAPLCVSASATGDDVGAGVSGGGVDAVGTVVSPVAAEASRVPANARPPPGAGKAASPGRDCREDSGSRGVTAAPTATTRASRRRPENAASSHAENGAPPHRADNGVPRERAEESGGAPLQRAENGLPRRPDTDASPRRGGENGPSPQRDVNTSPPRQAENQTPPPQPQRPRPVSKSVSGQKRGSRSAARAHRCHSAGGAASSRRRLDMLVSVPSRVGGPSRVSWPRVAIDSFSSSEDAQPRSPLLGRRRRPLGFLGKDVRLADDGEEALARQGAARPSVDAAGAGDARRGSPIATPGREPARVSDCRGSPSVVPDTPAMSCVVCLERLPACTVTARPALGGDAGAGPALETRGDAGDSPADTPDDLPVPPDGDAEGAGERAGDLVTPATVATVATVPETPAEKDAGREVAGSGSGSSCASESSVCLLRPQLVCSGRKETATGDASRRRRRLTGGALDPQQEPTRDKLDSQQELTPDELNARQELTGNKLDPQQNLTRDNLDSQQDLTQDELVSQQELTQDKLDSQQDLTRDNVDSQQELTSNQLDSQQGLTQDKLDSQQDLTPDEFKSRQELTPPELASQEPPPRPRQASEHKLEPRAPQEPTRADADPRRDPTADASPRQQESTAAAPVPRQRSTGSDSDSHQGKQQQGERPENQRQQLTTAASVPRQEAWSAAGDEGVASGCESSEVDTQVALLSFRPSTRRSFMLVSPGSPRRRDWRRTGAAGDDRNVARSAADGQPAREETIAREIGAGQTVARPTTDDQTIIRQTGGKQSFSRHSGDNRAVTRQASGGETGDSEAVTRQTGCDQTGDDQAVARQVCQKQTGARLAGDTEASDHQSGILHGGDNRLAAHRLGDNPSGASQPAGRGLPGSTFPGDDEAAERRQDGHRADADDADAATGARWSGRPRRGNRLTKRARAGRSAHGGSVSSVSPRRSSPSPGRDAEPSAAGTSYVVAPTQRDAGRRASLAVGNRAVAAAATAANRKEADDPGRDISATSDSKPEATAGGSPPIPCGQSDARAKETDVITIDSSSLGSQSGAGGAAAATEGGSPHARVARGRNRRRSIRIVESSSSSSSSDSDLPVLGATVKRQQRERGADGAAIARPPLPGGRLAVASSPPLSQCSAASIDLFASQSEVSAGGRHDGADDRDAAGGRAEVSEVSEVAEVAGLMTSSGRRRPLNCDPESGGEGNSAVEPSSRRARSSDGSLENDSESTAIWESQDVNSQMKQALIQNLDEMRDEIAALEAALEDQDDSVLPPTSSSSPPLPPSPPSRRILAPKPARPADERTVAGTLGRGDGNGDGGGGDDGGDGGGPAGASPRGMAAGTVGRETAAGRGRHDRGRSEAASPSWAAGGSDTLARAAPSGTGADCPAEGLVDAGRAGDSGDGNPRRLSLVASGLSKQDALVVERLAREVGCSFHSYFSPGTTHVLMQTGGGLVCDRTLKYFLGIAGHCWVLAFSWVEECMRQGRLVDEAPFEIQGDVVNGPDHQGPRRSRLATVKSHLLREFEICCYGAVTEMSKAELECLVEMSGAVLVKEPGAFSFHPNSFPLLVMQPEANTPNMDFAALQRLHSAQVVSREWVLDCVATHTVRRLGQYLLSPRPAPVRPSP